MEAQRAYRLQTQRLTGHRCRDEGIAVTVTPDPASQAQEGGQFGVAQSTVNRCQMILQPAVEARQLAQEGVVVVGQSVDHFVEHQQARVAQHARLPQAEHRASQSLVERVLLLGRGLAAVAPLQQLGDLALGVEGTLALHLGRVCGQYRHDRCLVEESAQARRVDSRSFGTVKRVRQAALVRRRSGDEMGTGAADVMLVLGDVRQVREVAERADDRLCLLPRQVVENGRQLLTRVVVIVTMEADGADADALDEFEARLALLRAQRVTKDAPEATDVLAQRQILVDRRVFGHLLLLFWVGARTKMVSAPLCKALRRSLRVRLYGTRQPL